MLLISLRTTNKDLSSLIVSWHVAQRHSKRCWFKSVRSRPFGAFAKSLDSGLQSPKNSQLSSSCQTKLEKVGTSSPKSCGCQSSTFQPWCKKHCHCQRVLQKNSNPCQYYHHLPYLMGAVFRLDILVRQQEVNHALAYIPGSLWW